MIETLREIILEAPDFHVAVWGLVLGVIFGYTVYRTNYCAMGSISDIVSFGDYRRFRAWVLAAGVAMIGAWFIQSMEIADLSTSMYLTPSFNWLGAVIGGLMFGYGMVFAGGCVTKNIVRVGAGDLRSLFVLMVVGIFGYMTIGGLFALIRTNVFGPFTIALDDMGLATQSLGSVISLFAGGDADALNLYAMIFFAIIIVVWCFKDKAFRTSPMHVISGLVIGLCIIGGWFLTGLAADELADTVVPVGSFTFVRPTGDTLEYLMRFTALGLPSFGVITLIGTLIGAFFGALFMGRLQINTFADVNDTKRNLFGGAMMGVGGVLALGCTVGQALTGFSTLAVGSLIAFVAIVLGGYVGMHRLNAILMDEV